MDEQHQQPQQQIQQQEQQQQQQQVQQEHQQPQPEQQLEAAPEAAQGPGAGEQPEGAVKPPADRLVIPDSQRVVDDLRSSGVLEQLRSNAMRALHDDPELRALITRQVEESNALKRHRERSSKHLVSRLQEELTSLPREALHAYWRVLSQGPVSAQIDDAIRRVLSQHHRERLAAQAAAMGWEPQPFPPAPRAAAQPAGEGAAEGAGGQQVEQEAAGQQVKEEAAEEGAEEVKKEAAEEVKAEGAEEVKAEATAEQPAEGEIKQPADEGGQQPAVNEPGPPADEGAAQPEAKRQRTL